MGPGANGENGVPDDVIFEFKSQQRAIYQLLGPLTKLSAQRNLPHLPLTACISVSHEISYSLLTLNLLSLYIRLEIYESEVRLGRLVYQRQSNTPYFGRPAFLFFLSTFGT